MKTKLMQVRYNGIGFGGPMTVYFDNWDKAWNFLDKQECGEVDAITLESDTPLDYSDGCSWNELTWNQNRTPKDITKYVRVYLDDGINFREESYDYYCHNLGINPDIEFVKITNRGTISYTCGKPQEIRFLQNACRECGYKMAKKLEEADC